VRKPLYAGVAGADRSKLLIITDQPHTPTPADHERIPQRRVADESQERAGDT
jgi:hypothetical protein